MNSRQLVPMLLTVGLALVAIALATKNVDEISDFGQRDLIAFWSGARAFSTFQNPYDPSVLDPIQRAATNSDRGTQAFLNFPPALVVLLPMAAFDFLTLVQLWVVLNIGLAVATMRLIASMIDASNSDVRRMYFLLPVFVPLLHLVMLGQLTGVVLFGSVLFV